MTTILTKAFLAVTLLSADRPTPPGSPIDLEKLGRAEVVARIRVVEEGEGSKYTWTKVEILETYKRPGGVMLPRQMKVAVQSMGAGLPIGHFCTVYLKRYNPARPELGWCLVESYSLTTGETTPGFSHARHRRD